MSEEAWLPVAEPDIGELEERYVLEAVRSGWVSSLGPFVERFERDMARVAGAEHCVAVANGTVALHVTLVAMGVGRGDEVLVPDLTFAATAAAVVHAGATPVLVDVREDDWTIDAELAQRATTSRTKAVIPVHLFGVPADLPALRDAVGAGVRTIEDAAEAHGATIDGRRVGGVADAGCFSFYGNKLVTTGEGGCVTTNDAPLAARVRFLKDHAMSSSRRYFHPEVGWNYRLTNLQAALGCAQIERLDGTLRARAAILGWYREHIEVGLQLRMNPVPSAGRSAVNWLSCVLLPVDADRDAIMGLLRSRGIDSRPFFEPMHSLPPYESCRRVTRDRSVAASLAQRGLCLPSSNKIRERDVARVAECLRYALRL